MRMMIKKICELKKFWEAKILQQIFIEYKQMIQYCVDTFEFDFLILCQEVKVV